MSSGAKKDKVDELSKFDKFQFALQKEYGTITGETTGDSPIDKILGNILGENHEKKSSHLIEDINNIQKRNVANIEKIWDLLSNNKE